ncbi:MAG: outer rane efflux protein [Capsulimonas sp.]|nr:outer rane efflux protein [Capsulimonas sp.]
MANAQTRLKKVLLSEIAAAILGVSVITGGSAAWAQQGNGAGNAGGNAGAAAGNGAGNGAGAAAPGANAGSAGAAGAGVSGAPGSNTGAAGEGAANGPAATNSPNAGTAPTNATGVTGANGAAPGLAGDNTTQGATGSTLTGVKGTTWDLRKTIAAAFESSSDLQIARRNVEIDQKRANQAADAGKPSIEGRASATKFDQATKVAIGGSAPVQVLGTHTETLELGISQRIDLTGQIKAATDQATLQKLSDQFQVQRIRNDRSLRADTIYYNLLRAQHQLQVAQANLATALEQQRIAQQMNAQQVGQKVDVLRANTQVANAQTELRRAQNNAGIARTNFNDLVGQPANTEIVLDDLTGVTVGGPAGTTATEATPVEETPLFASPTAEVTSIDIAKDLQEAYGRRPEVLAQQVNVQVAEKGIKLAHAGLEPELRLNASGDYYPTTSFQTPRQRTAAITASIILPLYDGGLTRDRVSEAKLRTENAKTTLESLKSDVSLDINQAYLNLTTAASQIDNANTALQQAVKTRDLALLRYRGGVALYLEVTDAQAALQAAENNQINAVYDYQVAQAQYRHALGLTDGGLTQ